MSTTSYDEDLRAAPAIRDEGEENVEQGGFDLRRRLLRPRTLVSFGLAIALILFIFRGIDIDPVETLRRMRQVDPWLYLLAFVAFYATFPLRGLRWRLLLENAGFVLPAGRGSWASVPALTEYVGLSWFVNCIVPAKLGDAYRGYLLKRNGGVSFSRSFGTIFAERLLDMIVLFGLLVLSGWQVFGAQLPSATRYIFVLGLLLVGVIIAGRRRDRREAAHEQVRSQLDE